MAIATAPAGTGALVQEQCQALLCLPCLMCLCTLQEPCKLGQQRLL